MSSKLLKVGGVDSGNKAKAFNFDASGVLKVKEEPNKGFFIGVVPEPVPEDFKGFYGIAGLRVSSATSVTKSSFTTERSLYKHIDARGGDVVVVDRAPISSGSPSYRGKVIYSSPTQKTSWEHIITDNAYVNEVPFRVMLLDDCIIYSLSKQGLDGKHTFRKLSLYGELLEEIEVGNDLYALPLPAANLYSSGGYAYDGQHIYFAAYQGLVKLDTANMSYQYVKFSDFAGEDFGTRGVHSFSDPVILGDTVYFPLRPLELNRVVVYSFDTATFTFKKRSVGLDNLGLSMFSIGNDAYICPIYSPKVFRAELGTDGSVSLGDVVLDMKEFSSGGGTTATSDNNGNILLTSPYKVAAYNIYSGFLWSLDNPKGRPYTGALDGYNNAVFYRDGRVVTVASTLQIQGYGARNE